MQKTMTSSNFENIKRSKIISDVAFMALVGIALGAIAAWVNDLNSGMISAVILVAIYGAYNQVLRQNNGILSGFLVGGVLGIIVGAVGYLTGGTISGISSGAIFGLTRGLLIGAVIGVVSRAEPQKGDSLSTKLFLAVGSVALGAVLGGSVGIIAGTVLGIIGAGLAGKLVGLVIGGIVGGYIGSYFKEVRFIIMGSVAGVLVTAVSSLVGGAFAGLILGAFSGSLSPMLLVASIAAFGGLSSRGLKAMVLEAVEAPSEMLEQGAVPFLVPAVITGAIIGTAASGAGGLIVLPTGLAIVGLSFGALGDIESRPSPQITMRSIVEMAMMGAEEWPIGQVILQVTGSNRRTAMIGAGIGLLIGLTYSVASFYLVRQLIQFGQRWI